ncbi:hypothetical protein [uncultured Mameliella sp.]|uniref:WD40 repeat domain-containing protein n=1 Tax=uncultured Mameliella sp. TaxID=1447087 RepID=UPI00260C28BA|nr:hypothetical protein [uncultured Mameliella sp.]
MIETKPPQALSLFDLIGREWTLSAPVQQVGFNASGSAVACRMEGGGLALLPMADAEHPEKRIRMEFDTGRTTIRPRENPVAPPVGAEVSLSEAPGFCALGEQGFAVVDQAGALTRVTARGQVVKLAQAGAGPVTALCAVPRQEAICVARGGALTLLRAEDLAPLADCDLGEPVTQLAISADGVLIAARCGDRIVVLKAETLETRAEIAAKGTLDSLAWSPDRKWIVAGCRETSLVVANVLRSEADVIEGFPAPVASAAFSDKANVLVASGAFRVVGWRCPDLPFGTYEGDPVHTGKPGLTLVDRVAPNPTRDSCAVGYANGLVTLCPIGQPDELMLVEGKGAGVTAMDWSSDGQHLALGFADGRAAILTFPKVMFK